MIKATPILKTPVIVLLLSALIGLFGQLKNIPQQTIIQTSVPKEQLATVYTSIGTISTGAFGVSSLIMGLLADYFGVRSVFVSFRSVACNRQYNRL